MKRFIVWLWCFPQMFLGAIVCKVTQAKRTNGFCIWRFTRGLSLGEYIFIPECVDNDYKKHEIGHTKQSYILGWLYLFIIGIPSIVWAGCFEWYRRKYNVNYYAFYTERWADMLGGVNRYQA